MITHTTRVEKRVWDKDDEYCVVPEFQVDLEVGTKIKITVEVIKE